MLKNLLLYVLDNEKKKDSKTELIYLKIVNIINLGLIIRFNHFLI